MRDYFASLGTSFVCWYAQQKKTRRIICKINDWFTTYILIQTVYILLQDCRQSVSGCRGQITCKINSWFAVLFLLCIRGIVIVIGALVHNIRTFSLVVTRDTNIHCVVAIPGKRGDWVVVTTSQVCFCTQTLHIGKVHGTAASSEVPVVVRHSTWLRMRVQCAVCSVGVHVWNRTCYPKLAVQLW